MFDKNVYTMLYKTLLVSAFMNDDSVHIRERINGIHTPVKKHGVQKRVNYMSWKKKTDSRDKPGSGTQMVSKVTVSDCVNLHLSACTTTIIPIATQVLREHYLCKLFQSRTAIRK